MISLFCYLDSWYPNFGENIHKNDKYFCLLDLLKKHVISMLVKSKEVWFIVHKLIIGALLN